ncbi:hypothetical protein [Rhodoferax sp. PAMC 29310]|uniref:hypothetical protein n=1 Tax=Rhodoferax sp. PAMC 29310 TaxID=2822760 RepID=UPI001B32EA8B|nr:hypothetical protein [Rhodoferax sp. PAMC 29310]
MTASARIAALLLQPIFIRFANAPENGLLDDAKTSNAESPIAWAFIGSLKIDS